MSLALQLLLGVALGSAARLLFDWPGVIFVASVLFVLELVYDFRYRHDGGAG